MILDNSPHAPVDEADLVRALEGLGLPLGTSTQRIEMDWSKSTPTITIYKVAVDEHGAAMWTRENGRPYPMTYAVEIPVAPVATYPIARLAAQRRRRPGVARMEHVCVRAQHPHVRDNEVPHVAFGDDGNPVQWLCLPPEDEAPGSQA